MGIFKTLVYRTVFLSSQIKNNFLYSNISNIKVHAKKLNPLKNNAHVTMTNCSKALHLPKQS